MVASVLADAAKEFSDFMEAQMGKAVHTELVMFAGQPLTNDDSK